MASSAMPQPQGAGPEAGGAPPQQSPQANPLQTALAQLAKVCEQMAQQNPVVNSELTQARSLFIQALQKTMMASRPQPESPAPQQGGEAPQQAQPQPQG